MELGPYSLVPGEDKEEKKDDVRPKLLRSIGRRVRTMSSIPTCGPSGTLCWLLGATWRPFFVYSLYGGGCIACWYYTGKTVHTILNFPDHPSSISAVIQFLAAFLTGLTMTEAAARYKAAMAALLEFRDATETLRVSLCSSTPDPKLRISINMFIAWGMCLFQKTIVFFTEDFSDPMRTFIPVELCQCCLFRPEVLWNYDLVQYQYVFSNFMLNAQLWDRKEKIIEKLWARKLNALRELHELLQVRSPTTKFTVGSIAVNLFLISIPLVNADLISPVVLPIVAAMFYAVMQLAFEIGDPWGEGADNLHDLPLLNVMRFLSTPMFSETDKGEIDMCVAWLTRGLQEGKWDYPGDARGEHTIPRKKHTDPNRGETIDFLSMRTLADVAGYRSWDSFLAKQGSDMWAAEQNGRRLPTYLRWNQWDMGGPGRPDDFV